jgi:hypothetical protein
LIWIGEEMKMLARGETRSNIANIPSKGHITHELQVPFVLYKTFRSRTFTINRIGIGKEIRC